MKWFHLLFLLFMNNNFLFSMEAECKSLASFFNINIFSLLYDDIAHQIAQYYFCDKQWWYVDKDSAHKETVISASFNKDATEMITIARNDFYKDRELYIWDCNTGNPIVKQKVDKSYFIKKALFNKTDNKILIINEVNKQLFIVDRDKDIAQLNEQPTKVFRNGVFFCCNKDESEMLVCNNTGEICIKNFETEKLLFKASYEHPFISACFNEDETEIATMAENGTLHIWDRKENYRYLLRYKYNFIGRGVSFNKNGNELLVYGYSPVAYIQDRNSGEILMELVHPQNVLCACFNNKNAIFTLANDGYIRIWDSNKQMISQFGSYCTIESFVCNNECTKIITPIGNYARIWARYDAYTLPQLLLKKLLHVWLQVKKPNKKINSFKRLLRVVARRFDFEKKELKLVWNSFSKIMQNAIWLSMEYKIQKYGK